MPSCCCSSYFYQFWYFFCLSYLILFDFACVSYYLNFIILFCYIAFFLRMIYVLKFCWFNLLIPVIIIILIIVNIIITIITIIIFFYCLNICKIMNCRCTREMSWTYIPVKSHQYIPCHQTCVFTLFGCSRMYDEIVGVLIIFGGL